MRVLEIPVKKWCRKEYENAHGSRCAIGWLRHRNEELAKAGKEVLPAIPSDAQWTIIETNDELYGPKRRKELRKLFKSHGIKLVFKD